MARSFGLIGVLSILFFASANAVALESLIDPVAFLMVFGGTVFYALMQVGFRMNAPETAGYIAEGAVALGWLGFLIGMFGIFTYNIDLASIKLQWIGDAMLAVLYGYFIKWIVAPPLKDLLEQHQP